MDVESILDIKRKNFKSIIDYIRFQDEWQKKDISAELGLSFATVSSTINDMMEIGMVRTTQSTQKTVGRAPKNFTIVPNCFLMIVINIQQPHLILMTAINMKRQVLATSEFHYETDDDIELFIDQLAAFYHSFMEQNSFSDDTVIGIGVVARGLYDSSTGKIVGTFSHLLQNQPVGKMLSARIQKMIWVGNDADFAAYELAFRHHAENLIYIYCDSGIGLGVVNNGRSLSGVNGYTAELSHAPFGELGTECSFCHHTDCLQNDVERSGFLSKYYGRLVAQKDVTQKMWDDFVRNVAAGERDAVNAVMQNARILARIYALLASVLHPEMTVLGGMAEPIYQVMRPEIEREINSRELQAHFIHLMYDPDYQHTVAMGAAETVYYHWKPNLDDLKKRFIQQDEKRSARPETQD